MLVIRVLICDTFSLYCVCRDLSFNSVDKLPALSFVNLPRLQRLYVRQYYIITISHACVICCVIPCVVSLCYSGLG